MQVALDRTRKALAAISILALVLQILPVQAAPIAPGKSEQMIRLGDRTITVFSYRPECANPSLLLVSHGENRKAGNYRDAAASIADRLCMIVVAPLFEKRDFPGWKYQRGGIVHKRAVLNRREWTGNIVTDLADWVRREEQRNVDYYLLGHSAGGQFLSRVAAFVPTDAKRIVIANPSTYVFPNLAIEAPYGLGGVYAGARAESELRRYLEQPVTIFLGTADTSDKNRNDSAEAEAQGATRYERGRNVYRAAEQFALSHGWKFNWRLVEAPGIGHNAKDMFQSKEATAALAP